MNKITKLVFLAIIYVALFNIPIFWLKPVFDISLITDFVTEMLVILPLTTLLFFKSPAFWPEPALV